MRGRSLHVLEGARDAGAGDMARGKPRVIARSAKAISPLLSVQRAGEQVEHRGLAGAVRPDQAENFAGTDLEADIVDGDETAKPPLGALDLKKQRIGRRLVAARKRTLLADGSFGWGLGRQRSRNGTMPLRAHCRNRMNSAENATISSWPDAPLAISGR